MLSGGTSVDVASGVTATIISEIAGGGSLTKTDSGTLIVSGGNTYSGGTAILGGTIQPNGDGSGSDLSYFGDSTAAGHARRRRHAASQRPRGAARRLCQPHRPQRRHGDGEYSLHRPDRHRADGQISGSGGFRVTSDVSGRGLTLTGNNTFTGGVTLSPSGDPDGGVPTVQIGSRTALGTGTFTSELASDDRGGLVAWANLSGGVANNIVVGDGDTLRVVTDYNANTGVPGPLTLSGDISGDGTIIKEGTLPLILGGDNSGFSGSVAVEAGLLQLNSTLYGTLRRRRGRRSPGPPPIVGLPPGDTIPGTTISLGQAPLPRPPRTVGASATTTSRMSIPARVRRLPSRPTERAATPWPWSPT